MSRIIIKNLPSALKKDSKFKEFLAVHEARKSKPLWADDTPQVADGSDSSDEDGSQKGDSALEVATVKEKYENVEEPAGSVNKRKNEFKQETTNKKTKIHNDVYTVKIRNLPYKCKKKQLKEFFHPLKIISLRMPPKSKGFAYVAFATEKDMNIALTKSRGFLGGHRVDVVKHTKKETVISQERQTEDRGKQDMQLLLETGRIFARNLCYAVTESDLKEVFSKYGPLSEVFLPLDRITKQNQGIAFISYMFPEHAVKALLELDGTIYQGRRLHLIPGQPKKEIKKEENDTNYKKKKETKLKARSGSSYNWNILFKNSNAVAELIAGKYNVEKSALLNRNSNESVAVRMAVAETQVVTESRKFLIDNGVELDAFSQPAETCSKTIILAKDLPANTSSEELNELFSNHGIIKRVVMPPSRMMALIEFQDPAEAKSAFENLAYCPFHDLPLFLQWAPVNTFKEPAPSTESSQQTSSKEVTVKEEVLEESENESEHDEETPEGSTVFVKNVNFCTTEERFRKHFEKCGPIISASISKKTDTKTGKMLSMGFGFVQFKDKSVAVKAVQNLQLSKLDGHDLELKFAKYNPNAESSVKKRKYEVTKQMTAKILVRNIPFEATEKEVEDLFKEYGRLKFVRLPLKMDSSGEHRGFGFVEFISKNEAKRAFETLCHSTHLYGRRLALEWANPKSEDVDEIRMKTAKDFARRAPKKNFTKSKLKEDVDISYVRNTADE